MFFRNPTYAYDALGRKGHTGGGGARYLNVSSAYVPNGQYKIAYDAASRLTREYYGSTYAFNRGYNYDDAGNRQGDYYGYGDWYYLGGFSTTYGAGNRETAVTDWMYPDETPLSYDFKGNVTGREMLWQSAAFNYQWDAYDRLTTGTQTGENWTVEFNYDALGRMLRREKSGAGAGDNVTFDYWLGLNKIAQETGGAGAEICVPDTETGATPADNGWYPRSNGAPDQTITYETDSERGQVAHIETSSTTTPARIMIGDYSSGTENPNDNPFNTTHPIISMWLRGQNSYISIAVLVTTSQTTRWLYLLAYDGTDYKAASPGTAYYIYAGAQYRNTTWDYLEVDLAARVDALESGETISRIDAIVPMGYNFMIDDIKLADGRLSRSWAQVPGAALGGYLGAQTGAAGANGVAAWSKYYYHFSDLGTVLATTNADGYTLGVYQPDFWGNYREVYGVRPDTMGLTGKFYDEDIDLYDFGKRMFDPERARWMSEEPLGLDGPNLYHFVNNNPVDFIDLWGLKTCRRKMLITAYNDKVGDRDNPLSTGSIATADKRYRNDKPPIKRPRKGRPDYAYPRGTQMCIYFQDGTIYCGKVEDHGSGYIYHDVEPEEWLDVWTPSGKNLKEWATVDFSWNDGMPCPEGSEEVNPCQDWTFYD